MDPGFTKFEPALAFICNKPAMHRVVNGWEADYDKNKTCLDDPDEILEYCKKVRQVVGTDFVYSEVLKPQIRLLQSTQGSKSPKALHRRQT